ncbi:hypothetical protein CRUP_033196 [Coryphaenoides rupestris]|nr:hypothetical protein CRUP_033196 [Coryphaenoides rupestris]
MQRQAGWYLLLAWLLLDLSGLGVDGWRTLNRKNVFLRRGRSRGDGTVPSGSRREGSLGRGDVLVVEEDTDLFDPIFQGVGGQLNPQWKPPRPGAKGRHEGKAGASSKGPEENITTDKTEMETDVVVRGESVFPRKPTGDAIIDLDTRTDPKKSSVAFPTSKIHSARDQTGNPEGNDLGEGDSSPRPDGTPVGKKVAEERTVSLDNAIDEKHQQGFISVVSRDGDMVLGSDGSWVTPATLACLVLKGRLGLAGRAGRRGDQGPPGPPGMPTLYLWKNTAEEWAAFQLKHFHTSLIVVLRPSRLHCAAHKTHKPYEPAQRLPAWTRTTRVFPVSRVSEDFQGLWASRETGATEGLQVGRGSQERRGRVGSPGSKDPLELLDQRVRSGTEENQELKGRRERRVPWAPAEQEATGTLDLQDTLVPKDRRVTEGRMERRGIEGPQGERGPTGFPGLLGVRGQQGAGGIEGENGENGLRGKQGSRGLKVSDDMLPPMMCLRPRREAEERSDVQADKDPEEIRDRRDRGDTLASRAQRAPLERQVTAALEEPR